MRYLVFLLCLIILGCGPQYKKSYNHSCIVISKYGKGSGVLIKKNLVITAAHVIDTDFSGSLDNDERNVKLEFEGIGVTCSGTVTKLGDWTILGISLDKRQDLALIKLDRELPCTLKFADDYVLGDEVFTIGAPSNSPLHISTGVVSAKSTQVKMSSCPVYPGNSGGGMFNTKGELIGIVTLVRTDERTHVIDFGPGRGVALLHENIIIPHCSMFIEMKDVFKFLGPEYLKEHTERKKHILLAIISIIGTILYVAIERKLLYKSLRRL